MMVNDIRQYIDIVENIKLDEEVLTEVNWSSMKDFLSTLGKSLTGDAVARGKIELNRERKQIEDGWKKYYTVNKSNPNDAKLFRKFLIYWNFSDNEIKKIITQPFNLVLALDKAAAIQWASAQGPTGKDRKPQTDTGDIDISKKPESDSPDAIVKYYKEVLNGDPVDVINIAHRINANPSLAKNDLELLAFSYLKATGKL